MVFKLSCQDCTAILIGGTSRSVADKIIERSRHVRWHSKRSSIIVLQILETENHAHFENGEILPK